MTRVRIKKLNENAVIPKYGSEDAAGADLYACMGGDTVIPAGKTVMIHTGVALEVPVGYAGLVYARSGLASKRGLAPANKVGVIDSDYRGEIMVALYNHSGEDQTVEDRERIAQLVITPVLRVEFDEVEELEETDRGVGGFGSTGTR
jgi:dUTP pyrophosphatase